MGTIAGPPGRAITAAAFGALFALWAAPPCAWLPGAEGVRRDRAPWNGERSEGALADDEAPAKLALLVGVDRYAPSEGGAVPALEGCAADVALMRGLLVERFGFGPEDVSVLVDEGATQAAILRAWGEHLIARAGPRTEVLFYFSGHGSRTPDQSGRASAEPDGFDSTLLAHDSRAGGRRGEFDLSDDVLRSLVVALGRRTPAITVVTDACHSGGGLRGSPLLGVRSVADGERWVDPADAAGLVRLLPRGVELLEDGQGELPPGYVHVAACARDQLAREIRVEREPDGQAVHGALTWFLASVLQRAGPDWTWRQVADDAGVRLSSHLPGQTVWSEGELERPVFGGAFDPGPPGYLGFVRSDGEVAVRAGWLHGLRVGSLLAATPAGAPDPVGEVRVRRLAATTASAVWVRAPEREPEGALRLVEAARSTGHPPLRLRTELELPPGFREWLREDERTDWCRAERAGLAGYGLRETEDRRLELVTDGGVRLWLEGRRGEDDERWRAARAELDALWTAELRFRALIELGFERGDLPLDARFVDPSAAELERFRLRSAAVGTVLDGVGACREERALAAADPDEVRLAVLEVTNPHADPVHAAVLSVSEDRARNLIWPAAGVRDNQLGPGEVVRVPVGVTLPASWDLGRAMRDRYLVFSTRVYADFSVFEHQGALRSERPDGAESALPPLLALALPGPARGAPVPVRTDSWGVTSLDLLVDRER